VELSTAVTLSRPALLVALYWEHHGAAPVGRLAEALDLAERTVYRALAELRGAGVSPSSHDHGHQHVDQRNPATDGEAPAGLVGELVAAGIWEGAARRLVAQHGEDRCRVQLAHHQARLEHGFTFRASPAAHLYAAIVHDYAPWVPPAPGALEARCLSHQKPRTQVGNRAIDNAASKATVYAPPATSREEACQGFARHREAMRAALRRG